MFSDESISSVSVSINGEEKGNATHKQHALYTLPWKPQDYSKGVHVIQVSVQVNEKPNLMLALTARKVYRNVVNIVNLQVKSGKTRRVEQQFSLDESRVPFTYSERFPLEFNFVRFVSSH